MAVAKLPLDGTGFRPNSLSASSIKTYLNCPRDYFYKYALRYKFDDFSKPLVFGSMVHSMLETHFKTGGNEAAVVKTITQQVAEHKMLEHLSREEVDAMVDQAQVMYRGALPHLLEWEPRDVERFGRCTIRHPKTGEPLGCPIGFKIDLITTKEQIVDHKTARSPYDAVHDDDGYSRMLVDEDDYQLYLYMLIYRAMYEKPPKELIFNVMLKRARESKVQILRFKPDLERETRAWETADRVYKAILEGKFDPNPHAKYCDACTQYPV